MVSTDDGNAATDSRSTTSTSQASQSFPQKNSKGNAATGASAAGVRAISSQVVAFYFRAPIKAFFRTRVDYLVNIRRNSEDLTADNDVKAFARAINPRVQAHERWSWRMSSAGLLSHAVRSHGWAFIPNQIIPPLLANTAVGAVLYTSYLQLLGRLHQPSAESVKRVFPPPPPSKTFAAGLAAGAIQSLVAAPLDALAVRFRPIDILGGRYTSMWQYGYRKTTEIGLRGILAGWGLSLLKDSLGYGLFFATFEYVKAQSYYAFITRYYGGLHWWNLPEENQIRVLRPHYAIEPCFLMIAGIAASVSQQVVHHPFSLVQDIYHGSLAETDKKNRLRSPISQTLSTYMAAYQNTFQQCRSQAVRFGSWRGWLYRTFLWNTIKQVPGTSAGLIIFELVRRRYGSEAEAATIEKDGYSIIMR